MADVTKVQMLIEQCKYLLKDHPEDPEDPMSLVLTLDVFQDELKFIIKALSDMKNQMEFNEIEVIK